MNSNEVLKKIQLFKKIKCWTVHLHVCDSEVKTYMKIKKRKLIWLDIENQKPMPT